MAKDTPKISVGPLKPQDRKKDSLFKAAEGREEPTKKGTTAERKLQLMTLPVTDAEKYLIEDLGKKIQRHRSVRKKPSLNWKSILRAFIGCLDQKSFDGWSVADEEELERLMRDKIGPALSEKK